MRGRLDWKATLGATDWAKVSGFLMKTGSVLWLCGSAIQSYRSGDLSGAEQKMIAAMALCGFAIKLHETGKAAEAAAVVSGAAAARIEDVASAAMQTAQKNTQTLDSVAADVENMRSNPVMPGTPISDGEQRVRDESRK